LRSLRAGAPLPYLQGAISNPRMQEDLAAVLLRNRSASPHILGRIARNTAWTSRYEVKKGLASHPDTPLPVAMMMVHHLYWQDLRMVADDRRLNPAVRMAAEKLLKARLETLSLGELISLARKATRELIGPLRDFREAGIVTALLGNPRLVENDIIVMVGDEKLSGKILSIISEHNVWGRRYRVNMALIQNSRTPVHSAMHILKRLPGQDLRKLRSDCGVPRIVRVGADRRLSELRPRQGGRGPALTNARDGS